jgi:hypothetical protein
MVGASERSIDGSEVLHSSTIFAFKLQRVEFGPWIKTAALPQRPVKMRIVLEDVLKGKIAQKPHDPLDLTVEQRGSPDGIELDYYGLWSHIPLASGSEFIAFCHGNSADVSVLLKDDTHCDRLTPATGRILSDTRAALMLESKHPSVEQVMESLTHGASEAGDVFARYAWEKIAPNALSPAVFPRLLDLIQSPRTNDQLRDAIAVSLYDKVTESNSPQKTQEISLIRALVTLLAKAEPSDTEETVAEVYLPNLLGLHHKKPKYSPQDIFPGPERRSEAARLMQKFPQSKLNAWIATSSQ